MRAQAAPSRDGGCNVGRCKSVQSRACGLLLRGSPHGIWPAAGGSRRRRVATAAAHVPKFRPGVPHPPLRGAGALLPRWRRWRLAGGSVSRRRGAAVGAIVLPEKELLAVDQILSARKVPAAALEAMQRGGCSTRGSVQRVRGGAAGAAGARRWTPGRPHLDSRGGKRFTEVLALQELQEEQGVRVAVEGANYQ